MRVVLSQPVVFGCHFSQADRASNCVSCGWSRMIDIRNLVFHYPTGDFVLTIPELVISARRRVAIVGPSGSGKTTLLNILAGVLKASGALAVNGLRLDQISEPERRRFRSRKIGFVFQDFGLIEYLTAEDNILHPYRIGLGLRLSQTARREAARLSGSLGLQDRLHHYPNQLSHGEKQRIAICRALVTRPSLILADEPTGNLDPATKLTVLDTLIEQTHAAEATLLVVTHDMDLLSRFDEVIDFKRFLEQVAP